MRRWISASALRLSFPPTRISTSLAPGKVTQPRYAASIASLNCHPLSSGDEIFTVHGFVRSVRKQKHIAFVNIGDGSSAQPIQAVLQPGSATSLSVGAAVEAKGYWVPSPRGKKQAREFRVLSIRAVGSHDAETYPLQKKWHSPEFLRTIPHLRTRAAHHGVLLRFRSECIAVLTEFFRHKGIIQSHTPIITSSDCEGAGEVFQVQPHVRDADNDTSKRARNVKATHFFEGPRFLTVSSQLHLEALAQSVGKVWTLSPTFRAEHSDTPRHLSEFYMLEVELAFTESLDGILDIAEEMIRHLASTLTNAQIYRELIWRQESICNQAEEQDRPEPTTAAALADRWAGLCATAWPRITFAKAIQVLQEREKTSPFIAPVEPSAGLHADHERYIAEHVGKGSPVFVTDYPSSLKPFYMAPSSQTVQSVSLMPTVACFDLLLPDVCEIMGGSIREHRLEPLLESMRIKDLDSPEVIDALGWYIDLRRYGSVPHGGFGLGFDRLLAYMAGVSSLRDIVTFPRWYGRCSA